MRKQYLLIVVLLISCRMFTFQPGPEYFPHPSSTNTHAPALQNSSTPAAAESLINTVGAVSLIPEQAGYHASKPAEEGYQFVVHPDGPLYVGDQVSFEIVAPEGTVPEGKSAKVALSESPEEVLDEQEFQNYGIGERVQATMMWAWDTSGLQAGDYTLEVSVQPGGPKWTENVSIFPANDAPYPEPDAGWSTSASNCCSIHTISSTAAHRDLSAIERIIEKKYETTSQQLGIEAEAPIPVTFVPRVLGHGGFAGDGISLVYLDRNYSGSNLDLVVHHELVHVLDARINRGLRPTMFSEGMAVYLSGGHFKKEPLIPRAAALLPPAPGCRLWMPSQAKDEVSCGLNWYLPLATLAENFYFEQHEIGYLEAAALVEFMVDQWGWQEFLDFYTDIHPVNEGRKGDESPGVMQVKAIENALAEHFDITFDELETLFIDRLQKEAVRTEWVDDVWVTVTYYETVRRYQQTLDPSAHFMSAWLPSGEQMRERSIVADYLRKPEELHNVALEAMLVAVDEALESGDYKQARVLLDVISAVLDSIEEGDPEPFGVHPVAIDYLTITRTIEDAGYQVNRIRLEGNSAHVLMNGFELGLIERDLIRTTAGWDFLIKAG